MSTWHAASRLWRGGVRREEGEQTMTLEVIPFREAVTRAFSGEFPDAKTIVGLLLAERRLMERSRS
jgi:hypothetical protein